MTSTENEQLQNIIKTKKRHYVLEGKLSATDAMKYDTPSFIVDSFSTNKNEDVYKRLDLNSFKVD